MVRIVRYGVLGVLLVVVLIIGLLWVFQRRLIYFPDRPQPPAAAKVLPGARDVLLETSDGLRLGAWLVPPARSDRGVAVLVAPGNAGNRLGRVPLARALSNAGLTVLLLDYRGYGGNPGSPTQHGLARDARAAREYLIGPEGIPPDRIMYYGESLGTAVVTELSTVHPPGALVLRSPFLDLAAVGRQHYPAPLVNALLRDRFPVADLIGRVTAPTVVVYGTADSTVPAAQSRTVAGRAGGPVRLIAVDGADHNDRVLLDGAPIVEAVVDLADQIRAA
ncbi:MAG: alpha/beta hydrolase [Dactylosporangium sp.]|nr:alpha/beta hydrolase [Dactylosporangium sp.]